ATEAQPGSEVGGKNGGEAVVEAARPVAGEEPAGPGCAAPAGEEKAVGGARAPPARGGRRRGRRGRGGAAASAGPRAGEGGVRRLMRGRALRGKETGGKSGSVIPQTKRAGATVGGPVPSSGRDARQQTGVTV